VHGISSFAALLEAVGSDVDVLLPSFLDVFGHTAQAPWAVGLQVLASAEDPGAKDQVWISQGVIRVEMGDEDRFEVLDFESCDTFSFGSCSAANNTWAAIDKVSRAIHYNRNGRARSVRVCSRRSGSQNDYLRLTWFGRRRSGILRSREHVECNEEN